MTNDKGQITNDQIMNSQETDRQPQYTVAEYLQRQDAEAISYKLQEAGFSEEQISIKLQNVEPKLTFQTSQAKKGATGGAIAGAVLGAVAGFSFDLIVNTLPGANNPTMDFNPLVVPLIGTILGGLGIGIVGALAGGKVPKTNSEQEGESPFEYKVLIAGEEEDFKRAAEILVKQGIKVAWITKRL
jgi:hypothetical protein